MTQLAAALSGGRLAVTAEFGPPVDPDPAIVRAAGRVLAGCVDAVNVTDNQAATVKVSALASCALLLDEGVEPILQLTSRDRNRLGLLSELLGAWALGVRSVLALSGDPLSVGPYGESATHVRDVDSLGLTTLIDAMNNGHLGAGEPLGSRPSFLIAGAANPLIDSAARLEAKLDAGVGLFQTNIVYDVDRFAQWLAPLSDRGITERAPFLVGITPPRSTRMLEYMHEKVPGVEVDARTFSLMDGLDGAAAKARGIEIALGLVERLRALPGVAGFHLMAPGWETEAVPAIVRNADLEPQQPKARRLPA